MTNRSGIRQAAAKDRRLQFTALFHHITPYLLKDCFFQLKRKTAAGIDGVTWQTYQRDLDNRLASLHERLHRGGYRPRAARRIMIPKADGGERPISVRKGGRESRRRLRFLDLLISAVNEFCFQRMKETLGHCIIPAIPFAAHLQIN